MNTVVEDPVPADVGSPFPRSGESPAKPLLDNIVRGAHDTVDRVAAKAVPAVERLVGGTQSASDALKQRARDAGDVGHEWTESLRATVREHPLAALAVAVAVGVLVSHVAQDSHR